MALNSVLQMRMAVNPDSRQWDTIDVNGNLFQEVLMLVHTKHPDGTPALCKVMKDTAVIDLAGGEEFVVAYLPSIFIKE